MSETSEVSFSRTEDDMRKFCAIVTKSFGFGQYLYLFAAIILAAIIAIAAMEAVKTIVPWSLSQIMDLACWAAIYLLALHFLCRFFQRFSHQSMVSEDGGFTAPRTTVIDKDGITESSANHKSWSAWNGILDIKREKGYIILFVDKMAAYLVPESAFLSPESADDFYHKALEFWRKARSETPDQA